MIRHPPCVIQFFRHSGARKPSKGEICRRIDLARQLISSVPPPGATLLNPRGCCIIHRRAMFRTPPVSTHSTPSTFGTLKGEKRLPRPRCRNERLPEKQNYELNNRSRFEAAAGAMCDTAGLVVSRLGSSRTASSLAHSQNQERRQAAKSANLHGSDAVIVKPPVPTTQNRQRRDVHHQATCEDSRHRERVGCTTSCDVDVRFICELPLDRTASPANKNIATVDYRHESTKPQYADRILCCISNRKKNSRT